MWIVNRFGTVVVTPGHSRPTGPFYDIKQPEFKCHEHSDLSKLPDAPAPTKAIKRDLGEVPTVSGWLDWRDRSPQGEWGPRFRFYVVLRRDAACIDLYENEPEPHGAPGQVRALPACPVICLCKTDKCVRVCRSAAPFCRPAGVPGRHKRSCREGGAA